MCLHLPSLWHGAPTRQPTDTPRALTHPMDMIPCCDSCECPGIPAFCIYLPSCWVRRDVPLCSTCYAGDSGLNLLQKQGDMVCSSSPRRGIEEGVLPAEGGK